MKILKTITLSLTALLIVTTGAYAIGTLTPSGTAGDDTQYTLNDIYDKLTNFSDTPTATSSPFTVPGTVEATFNTLSEIYALLEAEEADLVPENIADGVTVFGVAGTLEGATELEWSAQSPTTLNWTDAGLYCTGLEGGWRLPTFSELLTAIADDWVVSLPEGTLFEYSTNYWSGNEYGAGNAWVAYWDEGVYSYPGAKFGSNYARCVR